MTYKNRNLRSKIEEYLTFFPVVILLGVRQCGKTTLAKMTRPDWQYYDLERSVDFNLITRDFQFFIKEHPHSLIIDEAQRFPQLFQELRGIIDQDREQKNRFLLTGSSSPELIKGASESLAGRVGIVELDTFKINEIYDTAFPSFYSIFENPITQNSLEAIRRLKPEINHDQLIRVFLKGGYPEPLLSENDRFHEIWMENYFQTYVQRDIRTLFPRLDITRYQRFISMLSAVSGTIVNRSQLGRSLDIPEKSIRDYLQIVEGSYIWRNIPSYEKNKGKSVVKMPKGNFRDSGFSHFLQGISNREQLMRYPNVGVLFEAFIIEELIKGLWATKATNWNSYYYRTRNGAEIDLILEGSFGTLPIEIKLGSKTNLRQIQSLKRFVEEFDLPLGLIINNSDRIEPVTERILQLPAFFI